MPIYAGFSFILPEVRFGTVSLNWVTNMVFHNSFSSSKKIRIYLTILKVGMTHILANENEEQPRFFLRKI